MGQNDVFTAVYQALINAFSIIHYQGLVDLGLVTIYQRVNIIFLA